MILWQRREDGEGTVLELEGAELLIYDLPHDLVGGHDREEVSIRNC